ncbi:MAG: adenylate kinase [Gammaproteobacteria bacterium]|jgi:adenylate kinase
MKIVMLGSPGSGKGTQAKLLVEKLGIPQVSTGDLLRAEVASGSDLGAQLKATMAAGELVTDDVVLTMLKARLAADDCANGYILDGFPRNVAQAQTLRTMLLEIGQPVDRAILIQVDEEEILRRILSRAEGRADDNEETVRHRMSVYHSQTAPVIDFYRKLDVLREIEGVGSVDDIFAGVFAALA